MNAESSGVPIAELRQHHCGWVLEVRGRDDDSERLMAMGVCAGRMVELVQHGDPLVLKVYGTRIGVAARLAERVYVQPCLAAHCGQEEASEGGAPA